MILDLPIEIAGEVLDVLAAFEARLEALEALVARRAA
jgi:hypothetical protein